MKLLAWIGYAVAQLIGLFLFGLGIFGYAQGQDGLFPALVVGAVVLVGAVGLLATAVRRPS